MRRFQTNESRVGRVPVGKDVMSDLIEEVNDDLRQQQLRAFWKENGPFIVAGAVLAVILTAGITAWRQWDMKRDMAETARYLALVEAPRAEALADFAKTARKDHAALAAFIAAGLHVGKKETDQAVAIYDSIAQTSGVDRNLRDLARLFSVGQRLDGDDPAALRGELEKLAGDQNVWRFSAREMQALLFAREGKTRAAADILSALAADPLAPQDLRARAFTLRDLYLGEKTPSNKAE